jgi:hypothetical protein
MFLRNVALSLHGVITQMVVLFIAHKAFNINFVSVT